MDRAEILQKAFDIVVARLEVLECSDWEVIHHQVAREMGIDVKLLLDARSDGRYRTETTELENQKGN